MKRALSSMTVMSFAVTSALVFAPNLDAQEHGSTEGRAHEAHDNHVSLFVGAASHLHQEETGFAIGLDFEREEDEGTGVKHDKTEFLLRFGTGYVFSLGRLTLRPTLNADYAGEHWTLVYGAALGLPF